MSAPIEGHDPIDDPIDGVSRKEFLKMAAALGGAAGLGGLFASAAGAQEDDGGDGERGRYVVVITHGAEDPNRAILPLVLAGVVASTHEVHVWMTLQGAEIAHRGKAPRIVSPIFQSFGNAESLVQGLREKGVSFGVCPPCAAYAGADDAHRYDFVAMQGGDWLMEALRGATAVWF